MEKFTWADLADAINKMPEEFRTNQVVMSFEDREETIRVYSIQTTPEDLYVNEEDYEDCGSLEDLKELHGDEFDEKKYRFVSPKGTPFLWDGF
jgi:hypothetical protein